MLTDQAEGVGSRLAWRVRWLAVRGLAASVAGVVVLGGGGRLVMLASRLLHPEAIGRTTEGGNRIGEFTVDGTIALVLFGGLLGGVSAGVVWALVREWSVGRAMPVGVAAVAIGGFLLVEADNRDFVILEGPGPDLVLLLGLVFVFGLGVYRLDRWLEHRLPGPGKRATVVYSLMVLLGAPLMIPTFGSFLSKEFCFCERPPVWTGLFLLVTAVVSVWWWLLDLGGVDAPPARLRVVGTGSVALAVVAGALHLSGEVLAIL